MKIVKSLSVIYTTERIIGRFKERGKMERNKERRNDML
jgi:hypothetical protein